MVTPACLPVYFIQTLGIGKGLRRGHTWYVDHLAVDFDLAVWQRCCIFKRSVQVLDGEDDVDEDEHGHWGDGHASKRTN